MRLTLDGQDIFGRKDAVLRIESVQRQVIERSVAGLDGVICTDLGARGRRIVQTGSLREGTDAVLEKRLAAIRGFIDDGGHSLVTSGGDMYRNLRMESFEVVNRRSSGAGICCEYRIVYRQTAVE